MKDLIVIDGRFIGLASGIGRFSRAIIRSLCTADSRFHFILAGVPRNADIEEFCGLPNLTIVPLPLDFRGPWVLVRDQFFMWFYTMKKGVSVFFSPYFDIPLAPSFVKKVITIHDMCIVRLRHLYLGPKWWYYRFLLRRNALRADAIFTVSCSSKNEICSILGLPDFRVWVAHHPLSGAFRPLDLDFVKSKLITRFHLQPRSYVLYTGGADPRKNLQLLFEYFSSDLSDNTHLVVTGKAEVFRDFLEGALHSRIRILGEVTEEELVWLYNGARFSVYPSLCEGFGFPVIESIACGCPVLVSESAIIKEFIGKVGILIFRDKADFLDKLTMLLTDDTIRTALAEAGPLAAATLRQDLQTGVLLQLFEELSARGKAK